MKQKLKKDKTKYLRAVIQLLFFIFLPGAFNGAFSGIKYVFTQLGKSELVEVNSFVYMLIALCMYTFVFGRFFCGYACSFGALGDAMRAIYVGACKKIEKKPYSLSVKKSNILSKFKYIVLILILLLCFTGFYSKTKGYSPWEVFSMIHAGNFKLMPYILGCVLLAIILVGMCLEERGFCKFICPMGAIFSLLPVLPFFSLVRDSDNCITNCKACTMKCPSNIRLPEKGKFEINGDCFQCQKCIDRCPKGNIHTGIRKIGVSKIWFTVIRAILLAGLFVVLGV